MLRATFTPHANNAASAHAVRRALQALGIPSVVTWARRDLTGPKEWTVKLTRKDYQKVQRMLRKAGLS